MLSTKQSKRTHHGDEIRKQLTGGHSFIYSKRFFPYLEIYKKKHSMAV